MNLKKRWIVSPNGIIDSNFNMELNVTIPCDDIVDRTHYRPDSEIVRTSSISGSGLGAKGVYDDGDIPPSDLEVQIRSGKFDKAEVQQILEAKKKEVNSDIEVKEQKALSEARQTFVDKAIGFGEKESPARE